MATADDRAPARLRLALSLAGAGALLLLHLTRLPFHEMWRDEWQTWLTARSSADLGALIENTRYDGHPMLWVLLVWLVSKLTSAPWAMQALHALIAAAWSFVVLRYGPFRPWVKALLVLGYFPFFEYAVISRNYALGGLLAAVACVLVAARRPRPLALGVVLGLLAWSSVYGSLLALAMLALVALGRAGLTGRAAWIALAAGATGVGLAIVDGLPAPDSGFATAWNFGWSREVALRAAGAVWRGLLPLPRAGLHFWNSNVLDGRTGLQAVLGVAGVLLALWLLRTARARLFWALSVATLGGFAYFKWVGSVRHQGFYAVSLFVAAWFDGAGDSRRTAPAPRFAKAVVAVLLTLHVLAALYASAMDLRAPFSASRDTARWLEARGLARLPIVAEADTRDSPLAGLLDEPLFYVRGERWGSFVLFDRARVATPDSAAIVAAVDRVASERRSAVLLVLSNSAELTPLPPSWRRLTSFPDAIVADETYVVYQAPAPSPAE